jgi:hypothetical protein
MTLCCHVLLSWSNYKRQDLSESFRNQLLFHGLGSLAVSGLMRTSVQEQIAETRARFVAP